MKRLEQLLKEAFTFSRAAAEHRIGPYAAQASYFIILSLIPFTMFLISIVRLVLPYFMQISDADLIRELNAVLPYRTALVMEDVIYQIFGRSSGISVVTAAMAIWFSSRGIMAIVQGVNNVLSDGELQNYFFCRAMSVVYTFLFTIIITLTMLVIGFGQSIAGLLAERFPASVGMVYELLNSRSMIMFVVLTFFFVLFYKFMPKRHLKVKELLPGALLAALGWILFTKGFGIYVSFSKSYASIYGGISYIIFAMLWLYFCLNIMLMGAEFNRFLKLRKKS